MKIKWWAGAPRNGYMCLVVIWYSYKSTFERFLFRFSLLIGNLEVSGADLAIYLCQSELTSHFCDDTFVGGSRGMPRQNFFEVYGSLKRHLLHFEGSLEQNIKVLPDIFLTAYLIILNKYFGPKRLDFHLVNFWGNRPGNCFINFT